MEWTEYWNRLLSEYKLIDIVAELDAYEWEVLKQEPQTERICSEIYRLYENKVKELSVVKQSCMNFMDQKIEGIHLSSGRVKEKSSLLCKVISKRSENIMAFDSKYYGINAFNYDNIITDLIGIRFIINYRGNWLMIHKQLLKEFPLLAKKLYDENELLEHCLGERFQAEWPTVYYARGDSIQEYIKEGLKVKLKKTGYRGIHYILSFENTYIELQVRTIYDEAWSDCDHNYVYKREYHPSYGALCQMSQMLNALTNISCNMNDIMKEIYDSKGMYRDGKGNGWVISQEQIKNIDFVLDRLQDISRQFTDFRAELVDKQEDLEG